jgi:hypothetical protein
VLVVVALLERQQVPVEAGAQVVLDVEREAAREQPTPDHQDRLDEAGEQDQPDEHPQAVPVVPLDRVVDDEARQPRDDEPGALRRHGEDAREGERAPVRGHQAEQASQRGEGLRRHLGSTSRG